MGKENRETTPEKFNSVCEIPSALSAICTGSAWNLQPKPSNSHKRHVFDYETCTNRNDDDF